jgi:hypothetical protein
MKRREQMENEDGKDSVGRQDIDDLKCMWVVPGGFY